MMNMDDGGQRENGRHKMDHYKQAQMQWMAPQNQQAKESMKIMALVAERDTALQERNVAIAEKKAALAERDMALLQRDSALSDRNSALLDRDHAFSALQHFQSLSSPPHPNPKRPRKQNNFQKKPSKSRKEKDPNRQGGSSRARRHEWKGQDLGLNEVSFDDSTMPVPVCSCTGKYHQCYKWGNGGWQSACCTTTVSLYPLPVVPNKRHARMGGRKMSGTVFRKLLSRLAAEGYDLSLPVDLKDHWAKHGTNRYITIK